MKERGSETFPVTPGHTVLNAIALKGLTGDARALLHPIQICQLPLVLCIVCTFKVIQCTGRKIGDTFVDDVMMY